MKKLEGMGYHVMRTSGSHGKFDVIAYIVPGTKTIIKFIQCKVVKKITDGVVNRLIREFEASAPLTKLNPDVNVFFQLWIKETGSNKEYIHGA